MDVNDEFESHKGRDVHISNITRVFCFTYFPNFALYFFIQRSIFQANKYIWSNIQYYFRCDIGTVRNHSLIYQLISTKYIFLLKADYNRRWIGCVDCRSFKCSMFLSFLIGQDGSCKITLNRVRCQKEWRSQTPNCQLSVRQKMSRQIYLHELRFICMGKSRLISPWGKRFIWRYRKVRTSLNLSLFHFRF